jgi:AGZA family xanthine/uracil permease-like MFS transporter
LDQIFDVIDISDVLFNLQIFIGLFICAETLSITPQRHYPAFLIGIMPVIADWARGSIISGVTGAYSNLTIPGVTFTEDVIPRITDFSYQGLSNFAGGSLLQCIFITAIMMYMIDRKFIRALIWSLLAGLLSFFGLIHASTVGVLYREKDDGWRFTVAYAMLAFIFLLFEIAQRQGWVQGPEVEPDDLSSEEWTEWNRNKITTQTLPDNTRF